MILVRRRGAPIVPGTGKYKHSSCHGGSSGKGLIWSAYRDSYDEQVIVLQEDLLDENNDIYMVIKISDIRAKDRYIGSNMYWHDGPTRKGRGRGWKASKKKK